MIKSSLSKSDISDFIDSVRVQHGDLIANNCRREIDKLAPDQEVYLINIIANAYKNNPEEASRMKARALKIATSRFNS